MEEEGTAINSFSAAEFQFSEFDAGAKASKNIHDGRKGYRRHSRNPSESEHRVGQVGPIASVYYRCKQREDITGSIVTTKTKTHSECPQGNAGPTPDTHGNLQHGDNNTINIKHH